MNLDQTKAEIQQLFERWMACFAANDFAALKQLWLTGDETPFYVAEEHDVVMGSWEELHAYWAATEAINTDFQGGIEVIRVKEITPDDVICQFRLWWKMGLKGWPEAPGGTNRGMAVLKRVDGAWKFHSYMEAPMAAITYLRKLGASDATVEETKQLYMKTGRSLGQ